MTPFWSQFDAVLRDAYCQRTNPNGIVNIGIANNSLMEEELLQVRALGPTLFIR